MPQGHGIPGVLSELQHDTSRGAPIAIACIAVKPGTNPIGLDKANSNSLAQAYVQATTQYHRKAGVGVAETGKPGSPEQSMDEGLHHWQARRQNRSDRERIKIEPVLVSSAEIPGDAQNMFEISRKSSIPTAGIVGGLEVGKLKTAKSFHFLGHCGQGDQDQYRKQQHELPHDYLSYSLIVHRSLEPTAQATHLEAKQDSPQVFRAAKMQIHDVQPPVIVLRWIGFCQKTQLQFLEIWQAYSALSNLPVAAA